MQNQVIQYLSFAKDLPSFVKDLPSFAKDLPSFTEESPSFTKELPSTAEYFFLGRLGHRVFTGSSDAVFPTLMQFILSFMLKNLFELTYLQKDTYCSSSCPGGYYAKQTVSGN